MRGCGVRHAHSHFAGIGARCCYWLKNLFGLSFSFTGHANDIFEPTDVSVKLDDLVRSIARLKELHRLPFRVLIVGDGPMKEELEQLIDQFGYGDRLQLAGSRNQSEIAGILAEATIFALPCVTEKAGGKDNLPTVIMEAMASGLPCVSTCLAGVPEMVIDGNTGLLTEERAPDAFALSI